MESTWDMEQVPLANCSRSNKLLGGTDSGTTPRWMIICKIWGLKEAGGIECDKPRDNTVVPWTPRDWFQESLMIPESLDAQVPYIMV